MILYKKKFFIALLFIALIGISSNVYATWIWSTVKTDNWNSSMYGSITNDYNCDNFIFGTYGDPSAITWKINADGDGCYISSQIIYETENAGSSYGYLTPSSGDAYRAQVLLYLTGSIDHSSSGNPYSFLSIKVELYSGSTVYGVVTQTYYDGTFTGNGITLTTSSSTVGASVRLHVRITMKLYGQGTSAEPSIVNDFLSSSNKIVLNSYYIQKEVWCSSGCPTTPSP